MEREIVTDEEFHTGHFLNKPRHTMQLEWAPTSASSKTGRSPQGRRAPGRVRERGMTRRAGRSIPRCAA